MSLIRFHHSLFTVLGASVRKIIEPDYPFTDAAREELRLSIIEYRRRLIVLSVPVADAYSLTFDGNALVEETVNCGVDGYKVIRMGGTETVKPEDVVRRIAKAVVPILLQEGTPDVTIDPHPANWCFDVEGVMRYIDFAPPRHRLNGHYLVGFPQPTDPAEYGYAMQRYYTALGIIRSLRFSSVRAGGRAMEQVLLDAIGEYPTGLRDQLMAELANLPERQFRDGGSLEAIFEELDVWRIDDVREIAMLVADRMPQVDAEEFLNVILELTRVDFNIPLAVRSGKVGEAKKLIMDRWHS